MLKKLSAYIKREWPKLLPLAIIFCAFLCRLAFMAKYGRGYLDSDISSQMVLADLMNQKGAILPTTDWKYSTQIFLWNEWMYQIALRFFASWNAARVLVLAICLLLSLACYCLAAKSLGLSGSGAWTALVMVSTLGWAYAYTTCVGMMYYTPIFSAFLTFAIAFKLLDRPKKPLLWHALLVLDAICFSLEGIRIFMIAFAPMLAAAALLLVFAVFGWEKVPAPKEFLQSDDFRPFWISFEFIAVGSIGYLINGHVLAKAFSFSSYNGMELAPFELHKLSFQFSNWSKLLGYSPEVPLFSLGGIRAFCGLFLLLLSVAAFVQGIRLWKRLSLKQRFALLTFFFGLVISMIFCLLIDQPIDRYLIPAFLYAFLAMHMVWDMTKFKNALAKWLCCGAFAACVLFLNTWQTIPLLTNAAPEPTPHEKITDFLLQNNVTQGYATYWNANVLTELSDGQIDVWAMESPDDAHIAAWLCKADHLTTLPKAPAFLICSELDINQGMWDQPFINVDRLAYQEDGWCVFIYWDEQDLENELNVYVRGKK